MKKGLILILLSFNLSFAFAQEAAEIVFNNKTIDLGVLSSKDAQSVKLNFKFSNKGKKPLVIHAVKASCGCTSPKCSKTPVQPAGKDSIIIEFDPKDQKRAFVKQYLWNRILRKI